VSELIGGTAADDLLDVGIDDLLDSLAREDPAPGSGSVAALVVAMAAALAGKAARRSRDGWADAGGAAAQAHALRLRAAPLAISDARAYGVALELLDGTSSVQDADRDRALGVALEWAAEVPLRIAAVAADVAALACDIAHRGAHEGHGEAVGAAVLAQAAAETAAHLVAINLGAIPDDERVQAAQLLAEMAARDARAARATD
jgi:formiminotetrahydrofolate cyclodeaminase